MKESSARPVPAEISRANDYDVRIEWNDGHAGVYPARMLRIACPCAGCVDESTGERIVREDVIPEDVRPIRIAPVGRYAIQIQWSDGHGTGIYTFDYLRKLCPCPSCRLSK